VKRARYVMIGGFLGAGKTTAVAALARWLAGRGTSVGLITNDQSTGLVDSSILRSKGFAVEEIAGGCFCCRFHSLSDAVEKLDESSAPEVFVAEPVGSCTDLLATVSYPLRRIYGERYTVAPLSVLVDPQRALRILGLAPGKPFSPKVVYVYEKQLEEADLIVINKLDLLDDGDADRLEEALARRFPAAEILRIAARDGTGLEAWFERILDHEVVLRPSMPLDYGTYAEGEALLGWLNATAEVRSAGGPFDANRLLVDLTEDVRRHLAAGGAEVAHLKMTLDSGARDGALSVVSLVSNEGDVDVRESLLDAVDRGSLVINLRAEGHPELLHEALLAALTHACAARPDLSLELEHVERFQPAPPVPVYRITDPLTAASGEGTLP